jgi:RNA polymerase sigma factor (sigma-70 family)
MLTVAHSSGRMQVHGYAPAPQRLEAVPQPHCSPAKAPDAPSPRAGKSEPVPVQASDLKLAARCVSGDPNAQRELFERERRRVHATLFRILGTNIDMDDLVQEAFFEIFRSLRSFRGEASLRTWADRCTARVAYAYLARRSRCPRVAPGPETASEQPSTETQVAAREATKHLYAELDRLDPKQRLAFVLHVVDGRRVTEVAAIMESSLVATKSRIWRARRAIESRARKDSVLADFLLTEPAADEDGTS